jgi:hypothetical protein
MAIALRAGREGAGVTAVEVNLKFIWEVIQRIKIGETGLAYVIDKDGSLVAHPDISLVLQKTDFSALPQVKAALQAQPAAPGETQEDRGIISEARDRNGRAVLTAFARIEALDWYVFVEQATAEAYRPLYASLARGGVLLVAGLLLSILVGLIFARRMTNPIRQQRIAPLRSAPGGRPDQEDRRSHRDESCRSRRAVQQDGRGPEGVLRGTGAQGRGAHGGIEIDASTADGDCRNPAGDQRHDYRRPTGVRCHRAELPQAVRWQPRRAGAGERGPDRVPGTRHGGRIAQGARFPSARPRQRRRTLRA